MLAVSEGVVSVMWNGCGGGDDVMQMLHHHLQQTRRLLSLYNSLQNVLNPPARLTRGQQISE